VTTPNIVTPPAVRDDPELERLVSQANKLLGSILEKAPEPVTATWTMVPGRGWKPYLLLTMSHDGTEFEDLPGRPARVYQPAELEDLDRLESDFLRLFGATLRERTHRALERLLAAPAEAVPA